MNDSTSASNSPHADEQPELTPAQAYDRYLGPAMFAPWSGVLLDLVKPRAGERALDLACGTGIVTHRLASQIGESGEVVGVDISDDMLDVAQASSGPGGAEIRWMVGDAGNLDLESEAFDLLVCQQGFQFFPDKAVAAAEMFRVLDGQGRAAISTWKGLDQHAVFRAIFETEARHLGIEVEEFAVPFSMADPQALKQPLEKAGFGQVEMVEHSLEARFANPERFIELAVMAGAAVIPDLADKPPEEHVALLDDVKRSTEAVVAAHRDGDVLKFPMHANTAVVTV